MSDAIAVYSNERKLAFELIAKAKELGYRVVAWGAGEKVPSPEEFVQRGADAMHYVEHAALAGHPVDAVAHVLAEGAKAAGAKYVFVAGNRHGKELAPYLAAKLGAGMVTLASAVRKEGDHLEFDRNTLGGKAVATERVNTAVTVATFGTKLFEPMPADTSRKAEVTKHTMEVPASKLKVLETKQRESTGVNLEEAAVVVGVGRGFKTKEDLKMAFDLAATLGGQVGCSRPLATDLGWLSDEYWIGLSGKEVKPKLYVAAGISGQIQHTTGIRGSKTIVAINSNKDAPIFKMADYGIVGDLYKVLPALDAAIKKQKSA